MASWKGRSASLAGPVRPAGERCNGRCWLLLEDACGLVCTLITYLLGIGSMVLADMVILIPRIARHGRLLPEGGVLGIAALSSAAHFIGYNLSIILMMVSHVRCMLTNPGTAYNHVEPNLVQMMRREFQLQKATPAGGPGPQGRSQYDALVLRNGGRKWWCQKCDTFRPKHTHHCSTCRSCVLEMDHHCPWVNNCIGWRNHKYFVLFISYAWLGCVWTICIMFRALFFPPDGRFRRRRHASLPLPGWPIPDEDAIYANVMLQLLCVIDAVVCFLLSIFACVMACDQWDYMADGLGIVDKKQRDNVKAWEHAARQAADDRTASTSEEKPNLQHAPDAAQSLEASSRRCWWCCGDCACDNLPHIMGEPFSYRWLLPLAPLGHDVPMKPEDDVIASARTRLSQQHDGDFMVDENVSVSQAGHGNANATWPSMQYAEGPRQRRAQHPSVPPSANARHADLLSESYRSPRAAAAEEWHEMRHDSPYESDSGTSCSNSSGLESE